MSDSKPREFWIATESSITKNASGGTVYFSHTFIKNPEPTDIHVIEKSAFDSLKKECKRLRKGLKDAFNDVGNISQTAWDGDDELKRMHCYATRKRIKDCLNGISTSNQSGGKNDETV